MKANSKTPFKVVLGMAMLISLAAATPTPQAEGEKSVKSGAAGARQWSVQVDKVVLGNEVAVEPAFQVAIYEHLLDEVAKVNKFDKVFRSGDHKASEAPALLILKTTILKYVPGSETRRAVTTVSGATKIRVRFELCTRGGQILTERVADGNVRFFGGNLRATHNLAHNVAKALKKTSLPEPAASLPSPSTGEGHRGLRDSARLPACRQLTATGQGQRASATINTCLLET